MEGAGGLEGGRTAEERGEDFGGAPGMGTDEAGRVPHHGVLHDVRGRGGL